MAVIPANPRWSSVVIRLAVAADEGRLRRLAHLDSSRPLSGRTLIAEQEGALVAAVSIPSGAAIADPFVPTADTLALLRLRAEQLSRTGCPDPPNPGAR